MIGLMSLAVFGVVAFASGLWMVAGATSVGERVAGLLMWLIAAVLLGSGAIVDQIRHWARTILKRLDEIAADDTDAPTQSAGQENAVDAGTQAWEPPMPESRHLTVTPLEESSICR
jgi:hypothetical protein